MPAERRTAPTRREVLAAPLAGLVVLVLLFPWGGGVTTDPPTCYGLFGPFWTVPCVELPAIVAGSLMTAAVLLAATFARYGPRPLLQVALSLLAALIVLVLQSAWADADPPTCIGMFDAWTVPCGGWPAVVTGAFTGAGVLLALQVADRPSSGTMPG